MEFPQNSYYKLNQFLLAIIGQWPFTNQNTNLIRKIFVQLMFIISAVVQMIRLVEDRFDMDLALKMLPILAISIAGIAYTAILYSKTDEFTELWVRIVEDWNSEILESEVKIKEEYAKESYLVTKYITKLYVVLAGVLLMVFVLVTSFMSQILDTFLPLNESRPHQFPFEFEAFVDKQKYFILIILMFHTMAVVYVMFAVANETMFMVHMDHVLGMFAVLGHRLEHALPNDVESLKNRESVINLKYYHSIILCIKRHQKASEYAAILESYYAPCLIVSITMSILILSPAFVQLSEIQLMKPQDVFEAVFVVCFWFVHNYMGQRLIDLSSETATKVYFSQWYLCSQRLQKMLPMIMSQCEKPCQISVYDLYISSLYCFRQVMQMGISYCTVIKQLR